jgi:hypothetical protein
MALWNKDRIPIKINSRDLSKLYTDTKLFEKTELGLMQGKELYDEWVFDTRPTLQESTQNVDSKNILNMYSLGDENSLQFKEIYREINVTHSRNQLMFFKSYGLNWQIPHETMRISAAIKHNLC